MQTLPFSWDGNAHNRNGAVELQIDNAVPADLAAFVAAGILDASDQDGLKFYGITPENSSRSGLVAWRTIQSNMQS